MSDTNLSSRSSLETSVSRSPLIGREDEMRAIVARLIDPAARLITLIGPGGVGKTRLAQSIAVEASGHFPGGVTFVSLAGVTDAGRVPGAIAAILGLRESAPGEELSDLADGIGGERALLIVDNVEQVVSAGVFLSRLLSVVPNLSILATSRMPLHISGEFEYPIAPLSTGMTGTEGSWAGGKISPAMALFITRARLVRPDLALTEVNLTAIAEICRRLDGLPLAIELAAARSKVVSPPALLARLSNSLQVLTGGPRDAPSRLRSLRDAIRWSYDLLSPEEQRIFRGAGVFRGGFTVDAFAAVLDLGEEGLDSIDALVDRSLFVVTETSDEEIRISMLETLREFAIEEMANAGEAKEISGRHAEWVRLIASECYAEFFGPNETAAMNRLERELPNIGIALEWLVDHDPEVAGQVMHDVWYLWGVRGRYREGLNWLRRIEPKMEELAPGTRADVHLAAGFLLWATGESDEAIDRLNQSIDLYQEQDAQGRVALAMLGLGSLHRDRREYEVAEREYFEALDILKTKGHQAWKAFGYSFLGAMERTRGDFEQAVIYLERGLEIARQFGFTGALSPLVDNLGDIARDRGDFAQALAYYQETMSLWIEQGDPQGAADSLLGIGEAFAQLGDSDAALFVIAAAVASYSRLGLPRSRYGPAYSDELIKNVRKRVGDAAFDSAWSRGSGVSWIEAANFAISHSPMTAERVEAEVRTDDPLARFGLTAREREILDLLSEGKSNQEISEDLSISVRTAGTHVANIYGKLGCSNRAAAVSIALRAKDPISNSS